MFSGRGEEHIWTWVKCMNLNVIELTALCELLLLALMANRRDGATTDDDSVREMSQEGWDQITK
jgi:hypothetical protein